MKTLPPDDALELWLRPGPSRLNPAFPPSLEAIYAAETAAAKLRALKFSTLVGIVTGLAVVPGFWLLMPRAHGVILLLWLGVGLPAGLICHALQWSQLPIRWQERQTAAGGTVVGLCLSLLMIRGDANLGSCFFGGIVLLMMLDVIAGGLSIGLGAGYAVCLTVMFGLLVQYTPGHAGVQGGVEAGLMAVCALCATFAAWRLETEARRSWALMLRERVKRRALTHRNVELAEQARRDPLTGLANRRAYERSEFESWHTALDASVPLGLVVVDIDHFKSYNDFYGHPAGDLCLQTVARCLGEQLRGDGDMVARVGGEEFAILLPDLTVETVGDIAERVRVAVAALELPHLGAATSTIVTVSCGACSLVPTPGNSPKDLFAAADAALYAAKQSGRNRVCLADSARAARLASPAADYDTRTTSRAAS